MVNFLQLPRELRDLVYLEILLWERPLPTLGKAQWLFRFRRISSPQSSVTGEFGCAYAHSGTPRTCANFLCSNRQIYAEMGDAIKRVRRKGLLKVKLNCIAEDESFHYFTWIAAPLVRTVYAPEGDHSSGWIGRVRWWFWPVASVPRAVTRIERLWIDVRIVGDRSAKWLRNTASPDRTSWAICAALKRLLGGGPDMSNANIPARIGTGTITIDELVLNIVPPPGISPSQYLDEEFPGNATGAGVVHPRSVAKELVDVWGKIWRGESWKATLYQVLLEKIERVMVCVDGEIWRVRELKVELERGRAERRRLSARGR
jgi:hypothetical protein